MFGLLRKLSIEVLQEYRIGLGCRFFNFLEKILCARFSLKLVGFMLVSLERLFFKFGVKDMLVFVIRLRRAEVFLCGLLLQKLFMVYLGHHLIDQVTGLLELDCDVGRFFAFHLTENLEIDEVCSSLLEICSPLVHAFTDMEIRKTLSLCVLILCIVKALSELYNCFCQAVLGGQFDPLLQIGPCLRISGPCAA